MESSDQMKGLALLRKPFPPNQISVMCRPTSASNQKGRCAKCGGWHGLPAVALSYVGHAALTDRLLDADPSWTWEPLALGSDGYPVIDQEGGMWIKLTVCGVTRLGYGDAQGKTGGNAMKERIGDALRNAAMRFGCALDLWHKGDLHSHLEHDDDYDATNDIPESPRPKQEAHEDAERRLDAQDFDNALVNIQEALLNFDDLKAVFGKAYSAASMEQKAILKTAYDDRKAKEGWT